MKSKLLGFYTLSDAERKKLPRYPIPCFRMGRLARSLAHSGSGMGDLLVGLAVERCRQARTQVGAYALLVNVKNDDAKAFYQHYGFLECLDSPMTLYLPLG